ncbi:MAG: pyruvate formate-lyase-activating protein [Syntrophomonas sp.]
MQTEAYIHSIETMGTLEGPGLRYVIFMQGCAMRCLFCHNPDTWYIRRGRLLSVDWLLKDIEQYLPYIYPAGGVSVTGGEPLLQADFLEVLFRHLDSLKVHKVIDTSGFASLERVKKLIDLTDLVLLSIKSIRPAHFKELSGQSPERTFRFARYLASIKKPVWIRYVLIPGVTDEPGELQELALWIAGMPNIQRLELLPYNDLGVYKWAELGLNYGLPEAKPPNEVQMDEARTKLGAWLPHVKVV